MNWNSINKEILVCLIEHFYSTEKLLLSLGYYGIRTIRQFTALLIDEESLKTQNIYSSYSKK